VNKVRNRDCKMMSPRSTTFSPPSHHLHKQTSKHITPCKSTILTLQTNLATLSPPFHHLFTTFSPPSHHLLTTFSPPSHHPLTTLSPPSNNINITLKTSTHHPIPPLAPSNIKRPYLSFEVSKFCLLATVIK